MRMAIGMHRSKRTWVALSAAGIMAFALAGALFLSHPFTAQGCHIANAHCTSDHEVAGEVAEVNHSGTPLNDRWRVWVEDNAGGNWTQISGSPVDYLHPHQDGPHYDVDFGPLDTSNVHSGATSFRIVAERRIGSNWEDKTTSGAFNTCHPTPTSTNTPVPPSPTPTSTNTPVPPDRKSVV